MNTFAKTAAAALALCLAGSAAPAGASEDSLPARAVTALGLAIAMQGDLALIQIREELRRDLLQRLKPMLPPPVAAKRAVETKPDHE